MVFVKLFVFWIIWICLSHIAEIPLNVYDKITGVIFIYGFESICGDILSFVIKNIKKLRKNI